MAIEATSDRPPFVSSERAESILRHVADSITVQAPDGRLVYANDAALRALGFATQEELLSAPLARLMSPYELLAPDGGTFPIEQLPGRLALRGVESEQLLRYRIVETGEERWALVRGTPVYDEDGEVEYAINIFRDVTDTQHAEERQHAALALEYVADGVFLLDADGEIRFWNPAAESITGLRAAEVVGRPEGLGIPVAEQRRIFEKFYRVDPNLTRGIGGTGLGLYICKELVRRMDGHIAVESREGEGSTFSFDLPVRVERRGDGR